MAAKPDPVIIAAYLDDAMEDLDMAQRAVDPPNRFAAFHLQQAAEKIIKAVRLHRGLLLTKEHNLRALIDELPVDDPWRTKLEPTEDLSEFATTYRYPTSIGRRKSGLPKAETQAMIKLLTELVADARGDLLQKNP